MTIQEQAAEDRPPQANGAHPANGAGNGTMNRAANGAPDIDTDTDTDTDLDIDIDTGIDLAPPAIARPPTRTLRSRPHQPRDYRLRGLDLDALDVSEAPTRPLRKHHSSLRRRRRRLLVQWTIVALVSALVMVLLRAYVVQPYSVSSSSMVPTLRSGTDVLVMKPTRLTRAIHAGDIVVVHQPENANCNPGGAAHDLVERVIGLPGETIWSVGGTIYINGQRLNEPGWYNVPFGELGPTAITRTEIPAGSYFVMGDNRTDTCDSRRFGPVPTSSVVGRVVATVARNGHPFVHSI